MRSGIIARIVQVAKTKIDVKGPAALCATSDMSLTANPMFRKQEVGGTLKPAARGWP